MAKEGPTCHRKQYWRGFKRALSDVQFYGWPQSMARAGRALRGPCTRRGPQGEGAVPPLAMLLIKVNAVWGAMGSYLSGSGGGV